MNLNPRKAYIKPKQDTNYVRKLIEPCEGHNAENLRQCLPLTQEFVQNDESERPYRAITIMQGLPFTDFGDVKTFKVKLQVPEFTKEDELKYKIKTLYLSPFIDNDRMETVAYHPISRKVGRTLKEITKDEYGKLKEETDFLERIKLFDQGAFSNHPIKSDIDQYLNPTEVELVANMDSFHNDLIRNGIEGHSYFNHIASMLTRGYLALNLGRKMMSFIKGTENGNQLLSPYNNFPLGVGTTIKVETNGAVADPKDIEDLQKILAKDIPWYQNPNLKKPIDLNYIIRQFDKIGQSNYGFGVSLLDSLPNCIEAITSEVVHAINGTEKKLKTKSSRGNGSLTLEEKLQYIANWASHPDIFEYHIKGLTPDENIITPTSVRNMETHEGTFSGRNKGEYSLDGWSFEFYYDILRTLMSVLLEDPEPKASYFADRVARESGLHKQKTPVFTVPENISRPWEHDY